MSMLIKSIDVWMRHELTMFEWFYGIHYFSTIENRWGYFFGTLLHNFGRSRYSGVFAVFYANNEI